MNPITSVGDEAQAIGGKLGGSDDSSSDEPKGGSGGMARFIMLSILLYIVAAVVAWNLYVGVWGLDDGTYSTRMYKLEAVENVSFSTASRFDRMIQLAGERLRRLWSLRALFACTFIFGIGEGLRLRQRLIFPGTHRNVWLAACVSFAGVFLLAPIVATLPRAISYHFTVSVLAFLAAFAGFGGAVAAPVRL